MFSAPAKKYCPAVLLLLSLLTPGCARRYVPLALERYNYTKPVEGTDRLVVQYSEDNVLAGNKRYAKKAAKQGIRFVALKMHNPTADTFIVQAGELEFTVAEGRPATLVPFSAYRTKIKQAAWPYLLLLPLDFGYTSGSGLQYGRLFGLSPGNAVIPVFTAWGIFNSAKAIKANHDFRRDFSGHQLDITRLVPGQTVHKLLGFKSETKVGAWQVRIKK